MQVTDKGQVTIPKHIRDAAGVLPGSEVTFALEAGKIIISKVSMGKIKRSSSQAARCCQQSTPKSGPSFPPDERR